MSALALISSASPPAPDVGRTPGERLKLTQSRLAGQEDRRFKACVGMPSMSPAFWTGGQVILNASASINSLISVAVLKGR